MSRAQILAIEVDQVTMAEAVDCCLGWIDGDTPRLVVTPNAEIAYRATHESDVAAIINSADLVIPDGAGIVMASKLLGHPVPERVAGTDLSTNLLAALSNQGRGRVYLLGARPEVVAEAVRRIQQRFPGVTVAGYHDGFFTPEEEPALIREIREAQVDVLFAGMGVPRQEKWLARHLTELNAKVSLGIGGTIDVWAGAVPRAPQWMQRTNLEWLFRIVKFGRFSRSVPPLVKFTLAVFARKVRGR
ncbi:MAG TPA: WecB/TagA/CpsF family glycosyltransferase [Symbiobacteriaceae bacterium]|nr:WecB/TagA/CpsF family glycosyltransferase [Symbiobacteriaceae bacterium]